MIVFDLLCQSGGEVFEAWFQSNSDFEDQSARGLVECPYCASTDITKAPMAPHIPRGRDFAASLAALQAEVLRDSEWVGGAFADTARAMHHGEIEPRKVHGQASPAEATALVQEGVPVAALPLPIAPPDQVN